MLKRSCLIFAFLLLFVTTHAQEQTYAEKLGYPKGAKVLILHIDDVGMSWDSNQGTIQAIEKGVANSLSMMMPAPGFLALCIICKSIPISMQACI